MLIRYAWDARFYRNGSVFYKIDGNFIEVRPVEIGIRAVPRRDAARRPVLVQFFVVESNPLRVNLI